MYRYWVGGMKFVKSDRKNEIKRRERESEKEKRRENTQKRQDGQIHIT